MRPVGQAAAGYFRTPPNVVARIARHVTNTSHHAGRILDPCSGEGQALMELANAWHLESFALELERERAVASASRARHTLRADAKCCTVQRLSMSALFLNPPYDADGQGRRTEDTWLKRWTPVLQPGAVLVYVIPETRFSDPIYDYLASYYRQLTVFRFPPEDYERFQQVVLFGIKTQTPHMSVSVRRQLERQMRSGQLLALPDRPSLPSYQIPSMQYRGEIVFRTDWLAPDEMYEEAQARGLWQDRKTQDALAFRPLATCRPLLPLRKGHLTRLIAAGLLNNQVLIQGDQHWIIKGRAKKRRRNCRRLSRPSTQRTVQKHAPFCGQSNRFNRRCERGTSHRDPTMGNTSSLKKGPHMKLQLRRQPLLNTLKIIHGLLNKKATMPILNNVLVHIDGAMITATATDLELGVRTTLEGTVQEPGAFTVPVDPLLAFLKEFDGESLSITTDETQAITVHAGKSKVKLHGLPAQDYPGLPAVTRNPCYALPPKDFAAVLKQTLPAVGEDDARAIFNAMLLIISGAETPILECIGTDGHRLAQAQAEQGTWLTPSHERQEILIPKRAAKTLLALLGTSTAEQMAIGIDPTVALFQVGDHVITARLIEGRYPNYRAIIPKDSTPIVTLPKAVLEDALRRVSVIACRESRPIRVTLTPTGLILQAASHDVGEAHEPIEANTTGEGFTTGFNTNYLLEALETMPGEEIQMHMASALAPCVLTTPSRPESWRHILMPIKVG